MTSLQPSLAGKHLFFQAVTQRKIEAILDYAVWVFQKNPVSPFFFTSAVFLLEQNLSSFQYDAKVYALAGSLRFKTQNFALAYQYFQKAKELDPSLALGDYPIRLHLLLGGKVLSSPTRQKNVLKDWNLLLKQGIKYWQQKEFQIADTIFQQMVATNPKDQEVLSWRGTTLLALNQPKEALKYFPKDLTKSGATGFSKAFALLQIGKEKEAKEWVQALIATRQHPKAHFLNALFMEKSARQDLMEAHLLNTLQKMPYDLPALNKIISLYQVIGKISQAENFSAKKVVAETQKQQLLSKEASIVSLIKKEKNEGSLEKIALQALFEGKLKTAVDKSKELSGPRRWIFSAIAHFLAGNLEKAQKTILQVPFKFQDNEVSLWKVLLFMNKPAEFERFVVDLNATISNSWFTSPLLETLCALGYKFSKNWKALSAVLTTYFSKPTQFNTTLAFFWLFLQEHAPQECPKNPKLELFLALQQTLSDEVAVKNQFSEEFPEYVWCLFARNLKEAKNDDYQDILALLPTYKQLKQLQKDTTLDLVGKSEKSLSIVLSPEALHNKGIALYRKVLQSQVVADGFEVLLFWKEQYLNFEYWDFWKQQILVEEDPRFNESYFLKFKEEKIEIILTTIIDIFSKKMSLIERKDFLTALEFSPFSEALLLPLQEKLVFPLLEPLNEKVQQIRQQLVRLDSKNNSYLLLDKMEFEILEPFTQLREIAPLVLKDFFQFQDEIAECALMLTKKFSQTQDSINEAFALAMAKKYAISPSIVHQVSLYQKEGK